MQIFNDASRTLNLYTNNTEVDYRNDEVTLDSILRVLTDRHPPGTARSRRLLSDENSNVLVYITGHGGDEFMKIQARFRAVFQMQSSWSTIGCSSTGETSNSLCWIEPPSWRVFSM